jgi:PPP family 3-phenylpropionic acid transporter
MMTASTTNNLRATMLNMKWFTFFLYGTVSVLSTFLPVYLQHLGFGKSAIGMMIAAGPLVSIIANPFWGYWSDRTQNIRRILLIILSGNFLIILAVFQLEQYAWVYGGMLAFFLFQTPIFSQSSSLILYAIEGTTHQFGSYRLWGSLGWAFMAVAAAPVIAYVTIDRLWIVYCALMIISIVLCFRLPRGASESPARSNSGFKDLLRNRTFLIFLLISILISTPHGLNGMFVSIYITELGGATWLIGWSAFLMAIFEVPIFLLLDRYLKKNIPTMLTTLMVVSGIYTVRWYLMSLVTEPWQIITLQATHGITFGVYYYVGTNLTSLFVPASQRVTGQSTYTLAWNGISGIIAGFLGSQFLQSFGYQSTYQVGMAMAFIGMVCFIWMRFRIKDE